MRSSYYINKPLTFHRRIRIMQPLWLQAWLAIVDFIRRMGKRP